MLIPASFQNFLAILIMWLLSYILTVTNVFTDDKSDIGYKARTDAKVDNVHNMSWFFAPYPGRRKNMFAKYICKNKF